MSLKIEETEIRNVVVLSPKIFGDERGYFTETYRDDVLRDIGFTKEFVQDNQSLSAISGTLRGLHFQTPPFAQDKLVRVNQGAIIDIAVDIRTGSPSYGKYVAVELTAENFKQLLVPAGFAHGFITTEPNTIVSYKVTNYYSPKCDSGIIWNDPDLAIKWPSETEPILSEKDAALNGFKDLPENLFPFSEFSF